VSRTILFVGHDAYRAGAQIALLHLLKWLRSNHDASLILLLKRGGELVEEYERVAPTVILNADDMSAGPLASVARRLQRHICGTRLVRTRAFRTLSKHRVDLIYVNSVASLDVLAELKTLWSCPAICHVHELEIGIQRFCGGAAFRAAQRHIDAYITGSRATAVNLAQRHGVAEDRIHRVPPGIPLAEGHPRADRQAETAIRRELHIPASARIVGGCGSTNWWKSPDLFVQVARRVLAMGPRAQIHFIWVGGQPNELDTLRYDTMKLEINEHVHFVGSQTEPHQYFSLFDVFLLTSREDAFPLVCLEAASMAIPIVCFDRAGGMPEFVEDDAGYVVPYLDVEATAECVLSLIRQPEQRARLGARAAEKVRARHDIEVMGPQLVQVLRTYL
jgi:glycosyltransferase involved in cell wall biosynthesis